MYKKLSQLIRFTIAAGLLVTLASVYTHSQGAAVNPVPQTYTCTDTSPSGGDDSYTTDEATPLNEIEPGVLANDCDDFVTNDILEVSSVTDTTTGLLTMLTGVGSGGFDYDPNGQFEDLAVGESTPDSFTYDVTDGFDTYPHIVTITIDGVNDPPTDISLSASSIAEHLPSGTTVGTFTTTDLDTSDTYIYSLVTGTGDVDNTSFTISGDALQSAEEFNYETKDTYNIRVQTDDGNSTFPKEFIITITDANDPPEVQNPIPDQNAAVGNLFTFTFAADSFIDLNSDPLTYTASKSDDTPLPGWLTFTPETRTFTGTPDVDDSGILSVKVTADDGNGGSVSDIIDIIIAGVIFTPSTGLTTSEGGGQQAINVELATQPTLTVVIGLNSNDTTEGTVSLTVLIFDDTNWDQQQLVRIDGVDDDIIDGDIPYNILTSITSTDPIYSQVDPPDLSVTNEDDDVAGFTIIPTLGLITSEDGTEDEFTIELDTEPEANVAVTLYSDDTGEGTVSPVTVTFTSANWDIPKTITVTGVDDDIADDDQPYTIVTNPASSLDSNYSGLDPEDVLVTNSDPDTPGYTAAPLSGLVTTEGEDSAFVDINLKTKPQEQITFSFESSDTSEGVVNPQDLTFDPSEWVLNEPITLQITGVDDKSVDGDKPYTVTITAVSDDPDYHQVIIAHVTNLDTPTIKWVKPVTTGVIFTINNSTAVLLKCEKDGSEPIDKVAFYYWDKVEEKEIKIGEDNASPYEIYFDPSPLHLGFNQIYCYAFGPTNPGDLLRISNLKHIWVERLPTEYQIHMPIINK